MEARFAKADVNGDGMLNWDEWIEFNEIQHAARVAQYPAGWMIQPDEALMKQWYDLVVTLDEKPEVTLHGYSSYFPIMHACMNKM